LFSVNTVRGKEKEGTLTSSFRLGGERWMTRQAWIHPKGRTQKKKEHPSYFPATKGEKKEEESLPGKKGKKGNKGGSRIAPTRPVRNRKKKRKKKQPRTYEETIRKEITWRGGEG